MRIQRPIVGLIAALCVQWVPFGGEAIAAEDASPGAIAKSYQAVAQPLLRKYCFECHFGDNTEAEIDLAEFKTVADARRQLKTWLKIREMLNSGQMPPPDAAQATSAEQKQLKEWVRGFLVQEAKAHAGDPGPVILRRLNNDEYNYTVRDLTGVTSLNPTREFPVDGAAGEGFTNAGAAQAMSPALVSKYLGAAKEVAAHAMLVPDGLRFSPHTSRRDQTDELLADIQTFYRRFTADGGGTAVDLHGIKFNTNQGGLLPVQEYLAATLEERDALRKGRKSIADIARERSLNRRYLELLWENLAGEEEPSLLIQALRRSWQHAKPGDAARLAAEIDAAQKALWKFNSIGHIGREGGPKSWMEAVETVRSRQDFRHALPLESADERVLYLIADDLGDGNADDFVVWERPRIEFKPDARGVAHPPILLRDVRSLAQRTRELIAAEMPRTADYLDALAQLHSSKLSVEKAAQQRGLNAGLLARWGEFARLGPRSRREIQGHYTTKLTRVQQYDAINGWGAHETPSLLTNRSSEDVSFLTLTVPARGVTVHPSPSRESVVAWKSPLAAKMQIAGLVADADNKCGNGAAWRVELVSKAGQNVLAQGVIDSGKRQEIRIEEAINVSSGDVVSLIVNARDQNHGCDTTHIALTLTETGGEMRKWDLAADVVDRILEGNPLPDRYGNAGTWHFCSQENQTSSQPGLDPGSALAMWRTAVIGDDSPEAIKRLAAIVRDVLTSQTPDSLSENDRRLREQVLDWRGPLRWVAVSRDMESGSSRRDSSLSDGVDPELFGKHPDGTAIDAASLCVRAPQIIEVRLPAALVGGAEFVVSGKLHDETGREGSVQLRVQATKPKSLVMRPSLPILVAPGTQAEARIKQATAEFRNLFPAALCYARIVPVDEVVTLRVFYREDDQLRRLMLNERQTAELERLWDELFYVAREPLQLAVSFEQISEFATQDRPDLVKAFAPMRKPINARAAEFRKRLLQTEPAHLNAVNDFADRAWRRPIQSDERESLRSLYSQFRDSGIAHEEAIRLLIARVLASPAFLYRVEEPAEGSEAAPVTGPELANRLSYFLWSSLPDAELRRVAETGELLREDVLLTQTRRMLRAPRTRRLAVQFACQWLHLRNFDQNDDKNEKLYPKFSVLRGAMYEETVRFFEEMFRNDGSILELLDGDHTFLNEALARHYGIKGVGGSEWRRVDGMRARGRGGILGMASFLASQSGASRTSPILRGNWVSETLLGERLPRPPANVPQLPDAVPTGLTARQLIERHSSVPECAKCHARIDPLGFALEQYDAIGRLRPAPVDTKTTLMDGKKIEGLDGLREYLAGPRRNDVLRQFCRKLLGFALGREVQLSDELLLDEMQRKLAAADYRFSVAVETIVASRQFREIRGEQQPDELQ